MKLYYWNGENNFGDGLSPMLVSRLSGCDVEHAEADCADLSAVGSILFGGHWLRYELSWRHPFRSFLKYLQFKKQELIKAPLKVWGSGFLHYPNWRIPHFPYRRIEVLAVRGKITYSLLRKYGFVNNNQSVVLGDPGLLYPLLLKETPGKKFELGFVPHVNERSIAKHLYDYLLSKGLSVKFIDVGVEDPLIPVKQIAECNAIISSSLHGLIVADGLGIPNRHIMLSQLYARSFDDYILKFKDYYSAFDMEVPKSLTLEEAQKQAEALPEFIAKSYSVDAMKVDQVKRNLMACFPRF